MNILVTGGSEGLGREIVGRLARDGGNRIYFTYPFGPDAARAIEASHPDVTSVKCDFTCGEDLDSLVRAMGDMNLDALVNNAMVGYTRDHFHKMGPDVFTGSFARNVLPVLVITQEALRIFRKKKFGKIVNILSGALINKPPIGLSEYVANKAYLESMSKSWATENARFNITSNSISPAFMNTGFLKDVDERIIDEMESGHPLKKLLSPGEIAEVVAFLMSATQHINGVNIPVNAASDFV